MLPLKRNLQILVQFKFSFKVFISMFLGTTLKWDFITFHAAINVTFTDIYRILIDFSFVQ